MASSVVWVEARRTLRGRHTREVERCLVQLKELCDYCQRRQWTSVTEYRDVISGAKFSRRGLDKLMADMRRNRLDVIVCFKLDRLGRSPPHLAQIVAELTAHRVALVCPRQGIDTSRLNSASQLQVNASAISRTVGPLIAKGLSVRGIAWKLRIPVGSADKLVRLVAGTLAFPRASSQLFLFWAFPATLALGFVSLPILPMVIYPMTYK